MIKVGLTGSIAMGKTETARMFAARDIPVFDSDAAVHQLYSRDGAAVAEIAAIDSSVLKDGAVDRHLLSRRLQEKPGLLQRIEAVVHPMVRAEQDKFVAEAKAAGRKIVLLDIPLLFETNRQNEVDRVIVVSAPVKTQCQRALMRPSMTPEKLAFILSRQMPDDLKRAQADYVIDTSVDFKHTEQQVDQVIADLIKIKDH